MPTFRYAHIQSGLCLEMLTLEMLTFRYAYIQRCIHLDMHTFKDAYIQICSHLEWPMFRDAYIQRCIHLEMHTFRDAYIQRCIHLDMHTFRYAYIQRSLHLDMHTLRDAYIQRCLHLQHILCNHAHTRTPHTYNLAVLLCVHKKRSLEAYILHISSVKPKVAHELLARRHDIVVIKCDANVPCHVCAYAYICMCVCAFSAYIVMTKM